MKSRQDEVIDFVAGLRDGFEQDLADLERHFPLRKRGTRISTVLDRLHARFRTAIAYAEEVKQEMEAT